MKLTEHFSSEEFECECGCGLMNADRHFLDMLEEARKRADTAFVINSGCRCPAQNILDGGKENSAHLRGMAADISCVQAWKRAKVWGALWEAGFRRIGVANTFLHCDVDLTLPNPRIWTY